MKSGKSLFYNDVTSWVTSRGDPTQILMIGHLTGGHLIGHPIRDTNILATRQYGI